MLLEANLLASPCLRECHPHEILIQEGFRSAATAYNDAMDRSSNDLIVFLHQDMILPDSWPEHLRSALEWLDAFDPNWGVLGCGGVDRKGQLWGHVYTSGEGILGRESHPILVQTLDEIVLILRKSSGLRFDERLPHFHFYGTDICLRAEQMGMKCYAISAFCIHNTHQSLVLPREFYESCRHIRRTWKQQLPIQTTCITITRFGFPIYIRRLRELYLTHVRRKTSGGSRSTDTQALLQEAQAMLHGR